MSSFGYLVVASGLHDAATVDRVTAAVRAGLDDLGGTHVVAADAIPTSPLLILVATGGTETAVLHAVDDRRAVAPFEPTILVAHPAHNSLPAALESLAAIQAAGGRGRMVPVDATGVGPVAASIADVAAIHRLHRTRLGQVGAPSPWLVASVPDADAVRERWGVELVPIDIAETISTYRSADRARAQPVALRYAAGRPPGAALLDAAALHPALVDAASRAGVDAVTVRCFDYLGELRTSGCVALAELNDTGTVAGCEGDIASAMAMLLVRAVLDRPSWIANPAVIDEDHDRMLLAHCTVAPSLVEDVELHTHFESGLGVGLRGRFAPGPATVLRVGGRALEQLWIADADIEASGTADDLCRTQVWLRLRDEHVGALLERPLGNHLVLVRGHHRSRIERWWRLAFG